MKTFQITRQLFDMDIIAWVLQLDKGIHISVCEGQLSHIGAVSMIDFSGKCSTMQFLGHKEGILTERWAKKLAALGRIPVVIEAGIHYDHLSAEGITAVMQLTDSMLEDVLLALSE